MDQLWHALDIHNALVKLGQACTFLSLDMSIVNTHDGMILSYGWLPLLLAFMSE